MKKLSYSDFWNQKGEYGKIRVQRMLYRKRERHYKRANRVRGNYRRVDGKLQQVCSYQPLCSFGVNWCDYPCNGDC